MVKQWIKKGASAANKWTKKKTPTFRKAGTAGYSTGKFLASQAINIISPGLWIFLSLILYLSDLLTNFQGTSFAALVSRFTEFGGENITRIGLFALFLGFIIFLFTYQKVNKEEDFLSSFVLAFVIGMILFLGEFNTGVFHIIFAVLLYFMAARPVAEKKGKSYASVNFTFAALLFIDFFGYNLLLSLFKFTGVIPPFDITNRFLFPIWFLYVVFGLTPGMEKSFLTKAVTVFTFVFFAFVIVGDAVELHQIHRASNIAGEQFAEATLEQAEAFNRMINFAYLVTDPIICIPNIAQPEEYDKCIINRQIKRNPELNESTVKGITNELISGITEVELVKSARFPSVIQKEFTPQSPIDYVLDISAPEAIKIRITCSFKGPNGIEFAGIPGPTQTIQRLESSGIQGVKKESIFCEPPKEYDPGFHKVIFNAEIIDITTNSYLTRLFVGPDISTKRLNQIKNLHDLKDSASESGEEFAVFSFNFGVVPGPAEPISSVLDDSEIQFLEGGIENRKQGTITKIKDIKINLIEKISSPSAACTHLFDYTGDKLILKKEKEFADIQLKKGQTLSLLKGCYFQIDDYLRYPKQHGHEYFKREFSSEMTYSYKITKEEMFEVRSNKILT